MSPRERASFDALSGGSEYSPYRDGGPRWRTLDAEHYTKMRTFYTGIKSVPLGQDPREPAKTQNIGSIFAQKVVLMLAAGPQPYGEICQTSSC